MRKSKFSPVKIREALDAADDFTDMRRKKSYEDFCRLATHPTVEGFALLRLDGTGPGDVARSSIRNYSVE